MPQILLVEDDVFLREMYVHAFHKEGMDMVEAEDGAVGIAKALATPFDLILLDIMMPVKTGIDVLKALRHEHQPPLKTPIILLTNLGQESVVEEAYELGADGYVLKADILPRQVVGIVRDFLSGKITKEDLRHSQSLD